VGRLLPRSTTTAGQRGTACRFSRCVDERAQLYACDLLEFSAEDLEQLIGNDGPGLMLSRAIEETPGRMTTGPLLTFLIHEVVPRDAVAKHSANDADSPNGAAKCGACSGKDPTLVAAH
jgi:hypothetical protein